MSRRFLLIPLMFIPPLVLAWSLALADQDPTKSFTGTVAVHPSPDTSRLSGIIVNVQSRTGSPESNSQLINQEPANDIERYLQNGFCNDQLCPEGQWWSWIIIDENSTWTAGALLTIRRSLLNTLEVLDKNGFDGRNILNGYRFKRHHGSYVDEKKGWVALVNHDKQEILLADKAFVGQGFIVYHELGHVVDYRLGGGLKERFRQTSAAHESELLMTHSSLSVVEGFWIREQGQKNLGEAAADAFALWVMANSEGLEGLAFKDAPTTVNYFRIVEAMDISFHSLKSL